MFGTCHKLSHEVCGLLPLLKHPANVFCEFQHLNAGHTHTHPASKAHRLEEKGEKWTAGCLYLPTMWCHQITGLIFYAESIMAEKCC